VVSVAELPDVRHRRSMAAALALSVVVLVLVPSVAFGFASSTRRSGTPHHAHRVQAFMTLYGYVDNSPPGRAIAHPCIHRLAGGRGTYANPVTFATDVHEIGWCQRIYVPYMKRYFIHEDECSECDHDWVKLHSFRFDMWAGGDAKSLHDPERRALLACEDALTRASAPRDPHNPRVLVDPPRHLPVTTAPIFTPPRHCWHPPR
jgi:hypothetical protein